jgi:hypothetical protein
VWLSCSGGGKKGDPALIHQVVETEDTVQLYTRQTLENPDLREYLIVQLMTPANSNAIARVHVR